MQGSSKVFRNHDPLASMATKTFHRLPEKFSETFTNFLGKNLSTQSECRGKILQTNSCEVLKFLQKRATLDGSRGRFVGFVQFLVGLSLLMEAAWCQGRVEGFGCWQDCDVGVLVFRQCSVKKICVKNYSRSC